MGNNTKTKREGNNPFPTSRAMAKIYERAANVAQTQDDKEREPATEKDRPTSHRTEKTPAGLDSSELVATQHHALEKNAQMGLFDIVDVKPSSEYPTLFARNPVFLAVKREEQKTLLDEDNAYCFNTPWGTGRRAGPCLTLFDEEVLVALLRLRQKRISGPPGNLPVQVEAKYLSSERVAVHTAYVTVAQIIREMGRAKGGRLHAKVLDSLRRLALTSVEITTKSDHRYYGEVEVGGSFTMVSINWARFQSDSIIVAQFTPLVARWLEESYTYLDTKIRGQLRGDYAKLIHKFLSSQKSRAGFKFRLDAIALAIGYHGRRNRMKSTFVAALKQLEELEWIRSWEITGTGRKNNPLILHVTWPAGRFQSPRRTKSDKLD